MKYYVNFTDSCFLNAPKETGIKAKTCIECETLEQAEEIYRNIKRMNAERFQKLALYTRISKTPPRQPYLKLTYDKCPAFHDE